MRVDQIEAKTNPETRRAFLTRAALLGVAAVMTFGVAETEAAPITEAGDKPPGIPVDKEMTQGEKDLLAETVEPDDRVQGAYGYYGHYRRVYRRAYRRTRRYVRRAYRRSYYY
jgi:hypothetical protein